MGAQGTTTINFGAYPGSSDSSVAVTGQAGIVAGSLVEAWIRPEATADHSADEHVMEAISVLAGNIVAGTGFTIYVAMNKLDQQIDAYPPDRTRKDSAWPMAWSANESMLYGVWTLAWVWN